MLTVAGLVVTCPHVVKGDDCLVDRKGRGGGDESGVKCWVGAKSGMSNLAARGGARVM